MIIVVKIGSQSLLQQPPNPDVLESHLDCKFLAQLLSQIFQLKERGHVVYLISSGAVAAGRSIWHEHRQLNNTAARQILAGIGQVELMQIYRQLAAEQGLHVVQLLLTKNDFISRGHYLNLERLLLSLQGYPELLPIINENDSVSIDELMFTDNDQLAGALAQQLGADLLLLLTEASGVYDRDPREPGARLYPLLGPVAVGGAAAVPRQAAVWPRLEGKNSSGRGGIASKLETARKMSRAGVPTCIASARQSEIILQVVSELAGFNILGRVCHSAKSITEKTEIEPKAIFDKWGETWQRRPELGTLVLPSSSYWPGSLPKMREQAGNKVQNKAKNNLRGVRKWLFIRDLAAGQGRIVVNDGLARKLRGKQHVVSILPVGIVSCDGEFSKGDLIDIYSESQEKLGIGLARYNVARLRETLGKHNQAIFIHYNYLHIENYDTLP